MHAKCSQCCSNSKKTGLGPEQGCRALSLNSAARRSHSAANLFSSDGTGHSHDQLRPRTIHFTAKCFLESPWKCAGNNTSWLVVFSLGTFANSSQCSDTLIICSRSSSVRAAASGRYVNLGTQVLCERLSRKGVPYGPNRKTKSARRICQYRRAE
jgi:hypothetical protein